MPSRRSNKSSGAAAGGDEGNDHQVKVSNQQAVPRSSAQQNVVTSDKLDKMLQELNQEILDS